MKRFIIQCFLFIGLLVSLFTVVEYRLRHIPTNYTCKEARIQTIKHQIETLVLGPCYAVQDINPSYFDTYTYNASQHGQTLKFDAYLFQRYCSQMTHLKRFILPISYFTYYAKSDLFSVVRNINYVYACDYSAYHWTDFEHRYKTFWIDQNKDFIKNMFGLSDYITVDSLGFETPKKENVDISLWQNRMDQVVKQRNNVEDTVALKINLNYLNEIILQCESKDIRLYLVFLPQSSVFLSRVDQQQLQNTFSITDSVSSNYPNVYFLNYVNDKRFNDSDFFDVNHLHPKGAEKFSRLLNDTISFLY
ncbi:hypothetical protein N9251_02195 [Gammaproteobacteria bacterium]|nr:hypothetical protein [Gammaproteobacteria bacterium]